MPARAEAADHCAPGAMAAATITIQGTVYDTSSAPLAGVVVQTEPGDGIDRSHSSPPGYFAITIASGGSPLAACAVFASPGFAVHVRHEQRPLLADADWTTYLLSPTTLDALYAQQGIAVTATTATLLVTLLDCSGMPVAGATVSTIPPAAKIAYQGNGTATDSSGLAYVLDAPPGPVTILAGTAPAYSIEVAAGQVTTANLTQ